MPVRVRCTGCGATLRFSDEAIGRKGKCPECGGLVSVVAEEQRTPARTAPRPDELSQAKAGRARSGKEGVRRLRLLLIAGVMAAVVGVLLVCFRSCLFPPRKIAIVGVSRTVAYEVAKPLPGIPRGLLAKDGYEFVVVSTRVTIPRKRIRIKASEATLYYADGRRRPADLVCVDQMFASELRVSGGESAGAVPVDFIFSVEESVSSDSLTVGFKGQRKARLVEFMK